MCSTTSTQIEQRMMLWENRPCKVLEYLLGTPSASDASLNDRCHVDFSFVLVLNKLLQQANSTSAFEFPLQVADAVKRSWIDTKVQCYYQRHVNGLDRCHRYYSKRLYVILANDYIPSAEDILHARKEKTLGIDEMKFIIEG